jgi:transposase-like protein
MAGRGIDLVQTTVMRWVQRYVPEFAKHWQRYARPVGGSWRIDETYIKIRGKWGSLYRGVDTEGQTLDFFVSAHRDIAAAKRFLRQAIEKRGTPQKITLDGYAASHAAIAELQAEGLLPPAFIVRTNRYVNNVIEQDHRRVKQRVSLMVRFKCFEHAAISIKGIELVHQSQKGQFDILAFCTSHARIPQVWESVLAA